MTKKKIAIGCGVLLITGSITIGAFGLLSYKVAKGSMDTLADSSDDARKLLKEKTQHPDTCIEEYVRRIEPCSTLQFECGFDAGMFGATCLAYVEVPEKYCDDVPSSFDLIRGPAWAKKRCKALGSKNEEQCAGGLLQMMSNFCHPVGGMRQRYDIDEKPVRMKL